MRLVGGVGTEVLDCSFCSLDCLTVDVVGQTRFSCVDGSVSPPRGQQVKLVMCWVCAVWQDIIHAMQAVESEDSRIPW